MRHRLLSARCRWVRILGVFVLAGVLGCATAYTLVQAGEAPSPASAQPSLRYPISPGRSLVPLGAGQPDALQRREAYKAVVEAVFQYDDVAWTAESAGYDGTTYAAGTAIAPTSGAFAYAPLTDDSFNPARAFGLHPARVAVFYSNLRDEYDQTVTWEEGNFEQLFRVYLWGQHYFSATTESGIAAGDLSDYDLLIVPAIRIDWADNVAQALGSTGLAEIRTFVEKGGTLYAQGDGAYLAEAAGLVAVGTVGIETRLTDLDNNGQLAIDQAGHPLTFGWLDDSTYVLNEPVFTATAGTTVVASYDNDTTHPGSPALLTARRGRGRVILMSGHPSDQQSTLPQVMDVLLWTMSQPAGIHGTLKQGYSGAVPDDVIPAHEVAPIAITTTFHNYWDTDLTDVVIEEHLQAGFTTTLGAISPAPDDLQSNPDGSTTIVWQRSSLPPGDTHFAYTAWSRADTLAAGSALVSTASADYTDPNDADRPYAMRRNDLSVSAKMAARLNGDRDIELDGGYPLPSAGWYYDLALTLENKEETQAKVTLITDVVALVSPIVDVEDQRWLAHVVTDTAGAPGAVGESLWVANEIFFYNTPVPELYPLPTINGGAAAVGVNYTRLDANGVYTLPGPFTATPGQSNSVTIPAALAGVVTLNGDGSLILPALVMVWDFGELPGYDHLDPALRYGLFSREINGRQVSFESDPMTDTGVVASGSGGSVFTNLGDHPIPYHEYLQSGIVVVPSASQPALVSYADIWDRPRALPLRTVFYDIVPFPPPEYHAVVNTTFELKADRDDDGVGETRVLDFPTREGADLRLYLKSHSNFAEPLDLAKSETLISQGMFHGLGFSLEPATGDWATSWSSLNLQHKTPDPTWLTATIEVPGYTYLYFQQDLDHQAYEGIYIDAKLRAYDGFHREGPMKIDDGARFVYHQKAVGPSRYEVFDSHVQAAFGLSSDAQVSKDVAPVLVATYNDQVYHFVRIEDPYDPRLVGYDPFIRSYGFGDVAATVYVGGRHGPDLLYPRVAPGGATQIRVELRNNSGQSLTNLSITPDAPAGIVVTERSVTETQAIEPLFFDFPFLHLHTVPDAWRTVYYYDVQVDVGFADVGRAHPIHFHVTGDNLPADFEMPDALLGVGADGSPIRTIYGQAADLRLQDVIPPYVQVLDARIGNTTEITAIMADLATGDRTSAQTRYAALRGGVNLVTHAVADGTEVRFGLPAAGLTDATQMPWLDNGVRDGALWVVFKSRATIERSGTNVINYGPLIAFTDDFGQVYTDTAPDVTVEAHGAVVTVTYSVDQVTDVTGRPASGALLDAETIAHVSVNAHNRGDYIAGSTVVTVTLEPNAVVSDTTLVPVQQTDGFLVFNLGDIAPNETKSVGLTMRFVPTGEGLAPLAPPDSWRVIQRTDGRFINRYVNQLVADQLAGELVIGAGTTGPSRLYLPITYKEWSLMVPDLVVSQLTLEPANPAAGQPVKVSVTLLNRGVGDAPAFWVDLYVDPDPPPTQANQAWYEICDETCIGMAWLVQSGLGAGQSVTLTSLGGFSPQHTIWPGALPGGNHDLYAYVDAWNPGVAHGAVPESDESNNRAQRTGVEVAGESTGMAIPQGPQDMPPR